MVVAGATVMRDNGLSPEAFTAMWETGRDPVSRETLVARYGEPAAAFILGGTAKYDWFRGVLPIGISRLAPAMTAFAMCDERVYGGDPVIVVNGHVPGLAGLFAPSTWVFDVGIDGDRVSIGDVRRVVIGDDSKPDACLPGSLRRDAVDGRLPVSSGVAITSRLNLVHCSDGLLAGLREVHELMSDHEHTPDRLTGELTRAGLTGQEVSRIVLGDPRVLTRQPDGLLSDLTKGLSLTACAARILQVVPPVFGRANGYADGVPLDVADRELQRAASGAPATSGETQGGPPRVSTRSAVLAGGDEALGRAALSRGQVGVLVPAGGTGGRFGGYDVAETDPSRQKAMVPAFRIGERRVSSLDIRIANVRYWDGDAGGRLPTVVVGSPTNEAALRHWCSTLALPYRESVQVLAQHGIYRLDTALLMRGTGQDWINAILRDADGRPSLKPPGSLGLLSNLILSGVLDAWSARGIAYLVVANGDDVGHRIDPRVLGYLARHVDVDAVAVGIPWGYAATVRTGGQVITVRGDDSGWSADEHGTPLVAAPADRVYDRGGALVVTEAGADHRLQVVTGTGPQDALFNTNQIYLRVSALERILDHTGATTRIEAVGRIMAQLPMMSEDKAVMVDGVQTPARQLGQPLHCLLALLDRCDIVPTTRVIRPGVRSSYAALKAPTDVAFAQMILDGLADNGDELTFARR